MPMFEFRFRQEFAAVDPPTIEIEADRVQTVTNDAGEILCVVAARGEDADRLIPLLSANTDRLLWWRQLPDEDDAKQPGAKTGTASTIPLGLEPNEVR